MLRRQTLTLCLALLFRIAATFHAPPQSRIIISSSSNSIHGHCRLVRMDIQVGATVIAGNDWNCSSSPSFGVVRAQSYELQRVYYQGVGVDGAIKRIDVASLDAPPPDGCAGFTKYIAVYSERYHADTKPVIVRYPSEVQLVTVKDEIADSAWLALPGLFWVWLAWTFYQYGESHGFIF